MVNPPARRAEQPPQAQRYYVDPQGRVEARAQPAQPPAPSRPAGPEYRYYRRPDGTVVRQRVDHTTRPVGSQQPPPVQQQRAAASPMAPSYGPTRPTAYPSRRPLRVGEPRWTQKRIAKHLFVIAIIIILLLASWPMVQAPMRALYKMVTTGQPGFQTFPESAEFTIDRDLSLTAVTNGLTYTIDIPKPFHIPKIHERLGLTTSPTPTSTFTEAGQEWMAWTGTIPRGGTAAIEIIYHMKLYSTMWEIESGDSGSVSDIPSDYDKYLVQEWKIDPTDAQVRALAKDIVGTEQNVYKVLLKIFQWMDENLEYQVQRSADPKTCSETLATMSGDCDDQSILLASLARSLGVPVWLNLGIIYDPVRDYWGGHGWNNVYIPLKGGDYVIATVDIVNDQFLFRDPYHVSDYIDNGDGAALKEYYTSWSYTYNGASPNAQSSETYDVTALSTSGSVIYYKP